MKEVCITLKIAFHLKEKLEALARSEQRSLEDQAVRLIEQGLRFFEEGLDLPVS